MSGHYYPTVTLISPPIAHGSRTNRARRTVVGGHEAFRDAMVDQVSSESRRASAQSLIKACFHVVQQRLALIAALLAPRSSLNA